MTTLQRTNCVTNPRAAVDTKGWKSYNDYVVRVEAAPVALPTGTTTSFAVPGYSTGLPAISDRFDIPADLDAGADYLWASCYAFVTGVEPHEVSFWASLKFYDDTGNEISWMAFAHDEIAPLERFELFQGLIKVPEFAVKFHVFIKTDEVVQGPGYAPNESLKPDLYFTQVQVENAYGRARLPFLYADGDSEGWSWEGTAHDSVSTCDTTSSVTIVEPIETTLAIPSDAWLTLPPMTEDLFLGVIYGAPTCFYQSGFVGGLVRFDPVAESVDWGDAFTATWEVGEGYQIDDVELDGVSIGVCTEKVWGAFTDDALIVAYSSGIVSDVQYLAAANGTITGTVNQSLTYGGDYGTQVVAVPDPGYVFVAWSDGYEFPERTDSNLLASVDLTATFELAPVTTKTLTYSAGAGGSVTGTLVQEVTIGEAGERVDAVASSGYRFVKWDDDVLTAFRLDANVTEDLTVEAQFAAVTTYTVTYAAGAGGSIEGTTPQSVISGRSTTQVKAVPATGYRFSEWSDGKKTAMRSELNVTASATLTASFVSAPVEAASYTLTYSAGAGGSISGTAVQEIDAGHNGTRVRAVPAAGYVFVSWSDDYPAASRIATGVHAELTVQASFALRGYKLSYYTGLHGTITGTKKQVVAKGADGTQVTAVPKVGYSFKKWSDGVLTAARTDLNVTANKYLWARYTREGVQ